MIFSFLLGYIFIFGYLCTLSRASSCLIEDANFQNYVDKWTKEGRACGNISAWDVSRVTNMEKAFMGSSNFNGDLSKWNVARVTSLHQTFAGVSDFNGDLSRWNVTKVTSLDNTFLGSKNFNGDLSRWNVERVTSMEGTFTSAIKFNADLSKWNVAKVTSLFHTFYQASNFNGDISKWNVARVTNLKSTFHDASKFNRDLSRWNVERKEGILGRFSQSKSLTMNEYTFFGTASLSDTNKRSLYDSWSSKGVVLPFEYRRWADLEFCFKADDGTETRYNSYEDFSFVRDAEQARRAREREEEQARRAREREEKEYPALKIMREQLKGFYGIDGLKQDLSKIIKKKTVKQVLTPQQCQKKGKYNEAWLLMGPPGVGKTSIARLLAPILYEAKLAKTNKFIEVGKNDLKGEYVGQTAPKVQKIFDDFAGGVIFVDEAYEYSRDDYEKIVAHQFLIELTKEVSCDERKIFIFAGYKDKIEEWLKFNKGMRGRVEHRLLIDPLPPAALAKITVLNLGKNGLVVNADPKELNTALEAMLSQVPKEIRVQNGARIALKLVEEIFEINMDDKSSDLRVVTQKTLCEAIQNFIPKKFGNETSINCIDVTNHTNITASLEDIASPPQETDTSSEGHTDSRSSDNYKSGAEDRDANVQHKAQEKAQQKAGTDTEEKSVDDKGVLWNFLSKLLQAQSWYERQDFFMQMLVDSVVGMVIVAVMSFFGLGGLAWVAFAGFKVVQYLLSCMLGFFKILSEWIWNRIADCCGCKKKVKHTATKRDTATDSVYARARDIVLKGQNSRGSLEEAMRLLWTKRPKEMCIHATQIKKSFEQLRESKSFWDDVRGK